MAMKNKRLSSVAPKDVDNWVKLKDDASDAFYYFNKARTGAAAHARCSCGGHRRPPPRSAGHGGVPVGTASGGKPRWRGQPHGRDAGVGARAAVRDARRCAAMRAVAAARGARRRSL